MKSVTAIPDAYALMESTRSIGYTFESAVADIVDNSISAECSWVKITAIPGKNKLTILDNGWGMDYNTLENAMKYGVDPDAPRPPKDLGRFGLGMKMASLSQCRCLTVISKKDGRISACRWDLDYIRNMHQWELLTLEPEEVSHYEEYALLQKEESGTLVVWEKLDKVDGKTELTEKLLISKINSLTKHLSKTFHRFLEGDSTQDKLTIKVNGNEIEPFDPFLIHHKTTPATFVQEPQPYEVDGHEITITVYVLPLYSDLSYELQKYIGGPEDLLNYQGFYIYRNKRLIIPGKWFGLATKKELSKNVRIQVDIPTSADMLWSIDVKKANATLPPKLKELFTKIIKPALTRGAEPVNYRGKREVNNGDRIAMWDKLIKNDQASYTINLEHPFIQAFSEDLSDEQRRFFKIILKTISKEVPQTNIYNDLSKGEMPKQPTLDPEESKEAMELLRKYGLSNEDFARIVAFTSKK